MVYFKKGVIFSGVNILPRGRSLKFGAVLGETMLFSCFYSVKLKKTGKRFP